jgi:hypothetical protein
VSTSRAATCAVISSCFFGDYTMSNNFAANARALGEASDGQTPLSGLYREVGLAAVANELNLQLNTLEPDVAAAVERGTAALLLAGREPGPTRHRRSVRAGEEGSPHKMWRLASKARRSPRFPMGKSELVR